MPIGIDGSGTITGLSAGGLPDSSITSNDIAAAAVTPAKLSQPLTLATAQNTTSGTSIDFTGIPSWVRRITLTLNGISTTGTSPPQVQLGDAGGFENTGYLSSNFILLNGASPVGAAFTAGFGIGVSTGQWASTVTAQGSITFALLNAATNTWVASGLIGRNDVNSIYVTSGSKSLSDVLTQLRLTTANGTDTFDAGSVNIMYEG